jgi:hypothetical protein
VAFKLGAAWGLAVCKSHSDGFVQHPCDFVVLDVLGQLFVERGPFEEENVGASFFEVAVLVESECLHSSRRY